MSILNQKPTHNLWRRASCGLLLALALSSGNAATAQDTFALNRVVTVRVKNQPLSNILSDIEKQTRLHFVYDGTELNRSEIISIDARSLTLGNVLHRLFKGNAEVRVMGNQVILKKQGSAPPAGDIRQEVKQLRITGTVALRNSSGEVQKIPGITVRIKATTIGTATKDGGSFSIIAKPGDVLVFSYLGYKTREVVVDDRSTSLQVTLEEDVEKIKEVVITGIFERKKESFTGATATYTNRELKQIGNQNVIQSLKTLDPAFAVLENNLQGANPNVLPDLEIRGKTATITLRDQFGSNANQPLFIMDGFEVSLQTVVDMNINRVASITVLRDAASTAIYGSRASNGVVVIETKKPKPGSLRVSYSMDNRVEFPDLRDYNLMNAEEKLEFERLAGRYSLNSRFELYQDQQLELDSLYHAHLAEVRRGVNTYWMNEPLRTGYTTGHNLYADGGDDQMRYGIGANITRTNGIMKGSGKTIGGGNIDLIYRKKRWNISNKLFLNISKATESPYGSFARFAEANPYFRKTDGNGNITRYLENSTWGGTGSSEYIVANPLWDAQLGNRNQTTYTQIINNLQAEYRFTQSLMFRTRLQATQTATRNEVFIPGQHSIFQETEFLKQGSYKNSNTTQLALNGNLSLIYGKDFGKHNLNGVAQWQLQQNQAELEGYTAQGFPVAGFESPNYATGYQEAGKPTYNEQTIRSNSYLLNGGYLYDRRYAIDASYRIDGSSVFGANRRFSDSWSVGLAWNLHNEPFLQAYRWINILKLRGSVGKPGNQNVASYINFTTYAYNTALYNYFDLGAVIQEPGNPNLQWQKKLDRNIGIDLAFLANRISFSADVYNNITNPLVVDINVPSSVGFPVYTTNLGGQIDKGFYGNLAVRPVYRPQQRIVWTVSLNARRTVSTFEDLGNKLDAFNKNNISKNLERYKDGSSTTAIWAVRSAGIDPSTGKEVFIRKDGTLTFVHSYDDETVVGDTRPDLEGVFGNALSYKGFSASIYIRYRFGGDVFNTALWNKVENISMEGLKKNQDKRALYDRWKQPGDVATFKNISATEVTPASSRFVQEENTLAGESIRIGYEWNNDQLKKLGLSYITLNAYMNDIFRKSTIVSERGINYPFSRSVSFSLSAGF